MKTLSKLRILLAILPITSQAAPTPFLIGGNAIDWECNSERCSYGHDLGHNGWSDLHLSMHGYWKGLL